MLKLLDILGVWLDGQDSNCVTVARGRLERENDPVCPDVDKEIPGLKMNIKEAPGIRRRSRSWMKVWRAI